MKLPKSTTDGSCPHCGNELTDWLNETDDMDAWEILQEYECGGSGCPIGFECIRILSTEYDIDCTFCGKTIWVDETVRKPCRSNEQVFMIISTTSPSE